MPSRSASPKTAEPTGRAPTGDPTELADRLHSAAIHLLRRLRREDDASGLPAPQLSALSVIVFGGPITLGALAKAEQVRPPTITKVVAALEHAGLVGRDVDPDDRRIVRVSLKRDTLREMLPIRPVTRYVLLGENGMVVAAGGASQEGDGRFAVSLPPNLPAGNYTVFTAIFLDGNTINPTIGRMDFRSN